MIIKKAEIEGFGKFANKSIEFKDGFNLITGGNEEGKSTLMSFIKMMFYSSSGKSEKGQDLFKSLRKKYRPWNGTPMSGAVEFESNGKLWRLHKEFLKSDVSDKTTVFCKTTGEEVKIPNPNEAGEYFLDMDLGEFERSIFSASTGGFSSDASGDSLAMRISNLSVSGDESISRELVTKRLNEAIEELVSKSGKKGLLVEVESELAQTQLKLQQLTEETKEQQSLFEEISLLEKEISKNEEKLKSISTKQKLETAKKELNAFYTLNNKINLRENINRQLSVYGKTLPEMQQHINRAAELEKEISESLSRIDELSQVKETCISDEEFQRASDLEAKCVSLRKDLDLFRNQVSPAKAEYDSHLAQALKKARIIPWILFSLFTLLSAALLAVGLSTSLLLPSVLSGCVFGASVILLTILNILMPKRANEKLSVQLSKRDYTASLRNLSCFDEEMLQKKLSEIENGISSKLADSVTELNALLSGYGCTNVSDLKVKTSSAKWETLTEAKTKLDMEKQNFVLFISELKAVDNFTAAKIQFNEILDSLKTLSDISSDIEVICTATGISDTSENYISGQIKALGSFIQNASHTTGEETNENIDEIEVLLKKLRFRLSDCQSRVRLPKTSEGELNSAIAEYSHQRDTLKSRLNALTIASEIMKTAITEANAGLGSYLSKKTSEYLNAMTNGKYKEVLVPRNLSVETRNSEGEPFHEWKYLSSGAIDRVYLALRLAATDIIAEDKEPLPLFLDDILSQYDDENCKNTLVFLKQYLKSNTSSSQILFFTCHGYIRNMVKEVFENTHEILL